MIRLNALLILGIMSVAACNDAEFAGSNKQMRRIPNSQSDSKGEDQKGEKAPDAPAPAAPQVLEQMFNTGGSGNIDFAVAPGNQEVKLELKLANAYQDSSKNMNQIDRAVVTKLYKQGSLGTPISEAFSQVTVTGVLDILIVVDDSGSMAEEQKNLASKLLPLLSEVQHADWRIAVVTTSGGQPCNRGLISAGDANASTKFSAAINAGTGGSATEIGIKRAIEGLGCQNPAWLRPDSSLAVLIISDEENSDGTTPDALKSYISGTLKRSLGTQARVYGIIWHPSMSKASCSTAASTGAQYAQLVADTAGTWGSICAEDYTPTLREISRNMASILKTQFVLQTVPDANSLVVKVNGVQQTTGFSVSQSTLTFSTAPAIGAKIEVSYVTGAQPQLKEFALGEAPAADTLQVTVNPAVAYTFDASRNMVVFDQAPAPNADIKISFRKNVALQKDFSLGATNIVPSSLQVKVNGSVAQNYSFNAVTGVVSFAQAPADAAQIKFSYKQNLGPILEYPVAVVGHAPFDLKAEDKATGAPVAVQLVAGKIKIASVDFQESREIVVSYRNENPNQSQFSLPYEPQMDSLVIESSAPECQLNAGLRVEGKTLHIECAVPADASFRIKYNFEATIVKAFSMLQVSNPEVGLWEVFVGGVLRGDYRREGHKIIFDGDLPVLTDVKIRYTSND